MRTFLMTLLNRLHWILMAIGISLILWGVATHPSTSAEELHRQALEARMKARRGHCTTIGQKLAACYAGDSGVCKALPNSMTWFTGEYGETPEMSCFQEDTLFGVGGTKQ